MRRRDLVAGFGAAAFLHAPICCAQQAGRVYRLGVIVPRSRDDLLSTELLGELGRQGFVEGKNLWVDPRGFDTPLDRFYSVAAEIVAGGVDAIAAATAIPAGAPALQRATHSVPLVVVADDVLTEGLVPSLAHPGGSIT